MTAAELTPNTALTETRRAGAEDLAEAWDLLNEYFEAIHVEVRDDRRAVSKYLQEQQGGIWLTYVDGEAAGCIALRLLSARKGEVKRLYVKPRFRRGGLAAALLAALESHAAASGVETLYLDSKDDLKEAIAFYEKAGFRHCARYNDNPQATIFLQKELSAPVYVRAFAPGDEAPFRSLNEAWISKLFKLEEKDLETLREPGKYILLRGGKIYMACRNVEAIGCCALLAMADGGYEVAKMGVAEAERGKGVGRALLNHAIGEARRLGVPRLYLETNHKLKNAIHLYESVGFTHLAPGDITPSPYVRADVYMAMKLS